MKYIRTGKNHWEGIYEVIGKQELYYLVEDEDWKDGSLIPKCNVVKQADNILELCDVFVWDKDLCIINFYKRTLSIKGDSEYHEFDLDWCLKTSPIYGAIWTEWGLKYVAKMNENGEFELL